MTRAHGITVKYIHVYMFYLSIIAEDVAMYSVGHAVTTRCRYQG